jgi:hypothetical protein
MEEKQANYEQVITHIGLFARIIHEHDIPGMLEDIDKADAFGPYLDPTLWMKNRKGLRENKEALEAVLPLWSFAQKLKALHHENQISQEEGK